MKNIKQFVTGVVAPLIAFLILFGAWEWAARFYEVPKWLLPAPVS